MPRHIEVNVDSELITFYDMAEVSSSAEVDDVFVVRRPEDVSDQLWQYVASVIFHAFRTPALQRKAEAEVAEFIGS